MNEKNNPYESKLPPAQLPTGSQAMPDDDEADRLWEELQALWDEQSRRIDEILASAEQPLVSLKAESAGTPCRVRLLRRHVALLCVFVAAAIYWGTLIPTLAYTVPAALICAAVEGAYLLIAHECLKRVRSLAASNPVRATRHSTAARAATFGGPRYGLTAVCIAAVAACMAAACAPTGDGYTMLNDQPSRAAVIEVLDQSIASI